jgi:putative transposase
MDLYHVLNRGVDKKTLFQDDRDRLRFVHDMFEFNDTAPAGNTHHFFLREIKNKSFDKDNTDRNLDLRSPNIGWRPARKQIVDIHAWCLMGNHYHLLLSERVAGGLTLFIRKLNIGYAKYFNERYDREGTLFQGRTKKKLITSDAYFLHILNYIHLNPLDFHSFAKTWRERRINDHVRALAELSKYRWSSYQDYCGQRNFPSIINMSLFKDVFTDYRKEVKTYLKNIDADAFRDVLLE